MGKREENRTGTERDGNEAFFDTYRIPQSTKKQSQQCPVSLKTRACVHVQSNGNSWDNTKKPLLYGSVLLPFHLG